jgi:hypothetical protein
LREDLWINDEYKPVDEFGTISLFKKVK